MRKPTFWFSTWSDTNQAVQLQKMARGLKFQFRKERDRSIYVAKTMGLISLGATAKLICIFVFTYVKHCFSHDAAQNIFKGGPRVIIFLVDNMMICLGREKQRCFCECAADLRLCCSHICKKQICN